ncbi:MAG: hypothetical protein A2171_02710 [Candidatus Levybacteria bacterium RBG_13_35_9]|nr:MAG: hypothetical protein A2171_02710 [Candidatus Levybacteria bacterium RBG_13_35_9]
MHIVIPGILEKNWNTIEDKIEVIKQFSNSVHIDFIDGKFAPNTTFLDPNPFQKYSKDLFLEAHLMVENPLQYLEPLTTAGFRRFLGHIEKMSNLEEFVAKGELLGEVGLAIDSQTDIEKLNIPYQDLDCLLLMGVKAGYSGQEFIPNTLERIKKIKGQNETVLIEVDGGVNNKNIKDIKNAGADRFVATSFLFKEGDPSKNFQTLLSLTS